MTTQPKAAWLASARAALEPLPEDRSRVEAKLVQTLGRAALVSSALTLEVGPPQPGPKLDTASATHSAPTWHPALKPVVWVSVGLLLGGVMGYNFGITRANVNATTPLELPSPSFEVAPSARTPDIGQLDPVAEDPVVDEPHVVVPTKSVSSSRSTNAQAVAPDVAAVDAQDDEVLLLQRVERGLRQGNAPLALGLLRELDEVAPKGRLMEERAAARIVAQCMLKRANARDEALRFEQQRPNSVHLARLRQACKQ